jgi:hypothetical protein
MELSINLTVDCSGLEAGVGVAKRYRGCHRSRAVCDEVLPAASVSLSFSRNDLRLLSNQIERRPSLISDSLHALSSTNTK